MAFKALKKIDKKLTKIYENQVTTNTSTKYIDRSEAVMQYMNFIAINNKNFLSVK